MHLNLHLGETFTCQIVIGPYLDAFDRKETFDSLHTLASNSPTTLLYSSACWHQSMSREQLAQFCLRTLAIKSLEIG